MLKRSHLVVGLVLIGVLGMFAIRRWNSGSGSRFQTVAVTRGPITQAVTATGTLNPVVNVQVGSQVSGAILADFNSNVHAGEVVAQIDRGIDRQWSHMSAMTISPCAISRK